MQACEDSSASTKPEGDSSSCDAEELRAFLQSVAKSEGKELQKAAKVLEERTEQAIKQFKPQKEHAAAQAKQTATEGQDAAGAKGSEPDDVTMESVRADMPSDEALTKVFGDQADLDKVKRMLEGQFKGALPKRARRL